MHGHHKSSAEHVTAGFAVALMHGYAVSLVVELNQELRNPCLTIEILAGICLVDYFKKRQELMC